MLKNTRVNTGDRALKLKQAMTAIRTSEYEFSSALLDVLEETPGVTIYGRSELRWLKEGVFIASRKLIDRYLR